MNVTVLFKSSKRSLPLSIVLSLLPVHCLRLFSSFVSDTRNSDTCRECCGIQSSNFILKNHWLGQVRESNRNLERQNEALAAQGMRARTALKDVEANRVNYAVSIIPCVFTEIAPVYHQAAQLEAETLRSEVSDCQEKLKTARQTITNLQGVNKEMEQLHSHSRALEEEKSRVTDAYTAIEKQMRSMQGMLAENEEIGVSK